MKRHFLAFFSFGLALLGCLPEITQPLTFDGNAVGGPVSGAPAELYHPEGTGPFPTVIVLHGCNGVGRHERIWAQQLASWGYVAVVLDSFRPRGITAVCNHGMLVPPELQAGDAFNAASYIRTQRPSGGEPIAVIGFSHAAGPYSRRCSPTPRARPGPNRLMPRSPFIPGATRRDGRSRPTP